MAVNDLNLLWSSCCPPKTDSPLVVDANAMLTPAIAFERLEPIPRGNSQLVEALHVPEPA